MAESYKYKNDKFAKKGAEHHPIRGYLWAGFLLLGSAAAMFSGSTISLLAGHIYVSNGIAAMGAVFAALVFGLEEIFTGPSRDHVDFIWKVLVSLFVGAPLGGLVGYMTGFGPLVQVPAMAGNPFALLLEAGMLYFTASIAFVGAYFHSRGVRA